MLGKTVSGIMLILLLISMLTLAFNIQSAKAEAQTVYINADGSITPAGAPIVTSDNITYTFTGNMSYPTYDGIVVERDNITIDGAGYTVQGSGAAYSEGIALRSTNVTIQNTQVQGFFYGIVLEFSSNNNILDNNVTANSGEGIIIDSGSDNLISQNNVTANYADGIGFSYSSGSPFNNSVVGNNIVNGSMFGIYMGSALGNYIMGNNIVDNRLEGIMLFSSSSNIIYGNNITSSVDWGINLQRSINNTFFGNTVAHTEGIHCYNSSNNLFYHNNMIGNTFPPSNSHDYANAWDNGYPSGGNYWSDYKGTDFYSGPYQNITGSDGIGDTPYIMNANNTDHYPLMSPWSPHNVAITNVVPCKTVVGQGYSLNINVTVANQGNTNETFNVTVYANAAVIGTKQVTLASGNSATITFTWDTAGFVKGNYIIWAYVLPVPGETDIVDNTYIDGTVQIIQPGHGGHGGKLPLGFALLM